MHRDFFNEGFSKVLGLGNNPPIEGVKITAIVKSDAPEHEISKKDRTTG